MEVISNILSDAGIIAGVSEFLIKSTLLLGIALAVQPWLRRWSPALRHLTLCAALLALPLIPVLGMVLPLYQISYLPEPIMETVAFSAGVIGGVGPAEAAPPPAAPLWPVLLALIWLAGTVLLIARLLYGAIRVRRIIDRTSGLTDPRLLQEIAALADDLGLASAPRCRVSREIKIPAVAGLSDAVVLLPAHLLGWPVSRLRPILHHECAHIRRRDVLWGRLSSLAVALLWFHPFVRVLRNRLQFESELACDDYALESGTVASEYADNLLAVARGALERPAPARAGLALFTTTQLERRIVSILSVRKRGMVVSKAAKAAVLLLVFSAMFPLTIISGPVAEATPTINRRIRGVESGGRSMDFAAVSWSPDDLVTMVDSGYSAKGTEDFEGSVIVRTTLDATGAVVEAHAAPSSGDAQLDAAAVSLVRKCTFKPGTGSGQPIDIAVNFSSGQGSSGDQAQSAAGSPEGGLPGPDDFVAADVYPEMISQVQPEYPEQAKADSVEGTVWVKALVDTTGSVRKAMTQKPSGDSRLDEAAVAAAYKGKFKPALAQGKPVAVWVTYKVTFSLAPKAE